MPYGRYTSRRAPERPPVTGPRVPLRLPRQRGDPAAGLLRLRDALYQTLHDARCRVRARLVDQGYLPPAATKEAGLP